MKNEGEEKIFRRFSKVLSKAQFLDFTNDDKNSLDKISKELADKFGVNQQEAKNEIIDILMNNTKADMLEKLAKMQGVELKFDSDKQYYEFMEKTYGTWTELEHIELTDDEKEEILNQVFPQKEEEVDTNIKNIVNESLLDKKVKLATLLMEQKVKEKKEVRRKKEAWLQLKERWIGMMNMMKEMGIPDYKEKMISWIDMTVKKNKAKKNHEESLNEEKEDKSN